MHTTDTITIRFKVFLIERSNEQSSSADQLTTYSLHDTRFMFDTEPQAETWISQLGEKGREYIVLKTYQLHS